MHRPACNEEIKPDSSYLAEIFGIIKSYLTAARAKKKMICDPELAAATLSSHHLTLTWPLSIEAIRTLSSAVAYFCPSVVLNLPDSFIFKGDAFAVAAHHL